MQPSRQRTGHLCLGLGLLTGLYAGCGGSSQSTPAATAVTEAHAETTGAEASTAPLPPSSESALDDAIAAEHRSAENRARDTYRHPRETLAFFGLTPGMRVVELAPGGGWYTEVLAPIACNGGSLVATLPDPQGPGAKYGKMFSDRIAQDPEVFTCVETVVFEPPGHGSLGEDNSADMVVSFRSTHGWINNAQAEAVYKAAFAVLKPGGVFGVVQHRTDDGANATESAKTGYVPEAYVVQLAENAGFQLAEKSDINRNPKDTHDHPEGVWTLPPNLRLGEQDKQKYEAIGESDRMTLKFVKPATSP